MLCGSGIKDAFQPPVHHAHPISGGCGQCVQKRGRRGHILASLGEGGELPLCPFHCHGPACLKHRFASVQVGQPGLDNCPFIGKLTSLPCYFSCNFILRDASSFLLASRLLLREGHWSSGLMRPCMYGLKHQGLLWQWCSLNGNRGHHRVAQPRERGAGALPPHSRLNHPRWAIPRGLHAMTVTRCG
jgi:hypothetical protein